MDGKVINQKKFLFSLKKNLIKTDLLSHLVDKK